MCFNKESSISTFISGSILSLLLYLEGNKYDKMIAIFCFVFGIMQLSEFFMWLDQDCGNINHYGSILGDIALNFQPLSILLLGYYYNAFYVQPKPTLSSTSYMYYAYCFITFINKTDTAPI